MLCGATASLPMDAATDAACRVHGVCAGSQKSSWSVLSQPVSSRAVCSAFIFFNLFDPAKGAFGFVSHIPWPTKFAVRFRAQLAAPGAPL